MKSFILSSIIAVAALSCKAQNTPLTNLPPGVYETKLKNEQGKWESGNIILLNDRQYKTSNSSETGDYKFSVTAQRIFFTSGPLKGAYATTTLNGNNPVIILPKNENPNLNLTSEVWAFLKQ